MSIEYKGYRIQTWIDDDTNVAQMLKGRRGPERLYVDIDPISEGDGRNSKRFGVDILQKHPFVGTQAEQLIEVAKLWVDAPERIAVTPNPVAEAFAEGRRRTFVVEKKKTGDPGSDETR